MEDTVQPRERNWRQLARFYLEDTETAIGWGVNGAIAALILLSTLIFIVETYEIPPGLVRVLDICDRIILVGFTLEYLVRLWSAQNIWRYAFSLYGLVDLVAILPYLVGVWDVRFIRLLRWFRILRFIRFLDDRLLFGFISGRDTLILARIVFTLLAIILIYSGLIFQVEHSKNPEGFHTFLDAVYFAVVTMTTVGFGDVTPVSQAGRGLTVMMILTGIALIPTQIGELIRELVKVTNSTQIPCQGCGLLVHDTDAQFCKRCGTSLVNPPEDFPGGGEGV